jgi:glyoxylase-like metal-dependent hydrolase (beta-lactamase superfamily II)
VLDAAHDAGPIVMAVGGRHVVAVVCMHGHNDHVTVARELGEALDTPALVHPRAMTCCGGYRALDPPLTGQFTPESITDPAIRLGGAQRRAHWPCRRRRCANQLRRDHVTATSASAVGCQTP